ncbi:c2 domain containing protein [Anaeramoeba flamelloides]|uniref:C2 domain containing protein n=1 Tax=Anaeramoeba flamelloides TaxID=1746091 RepID=A0ABQ8ZCF9_9EUKA|nr:c2 domain containing protein [Anaeramoeba flamelloides]
MFETDPLEFLQAFKKLKWNKVIIDEIPTFNKELLSNKEQTQEILDLAVHTIVEVLPSYSKVRKSRLMKENIDKERASLYNPHSTNSVLELRWNLQVNNYQKHFYLWCIDALCVLLTKGGSMNYIGENTNLVSLMLKGTPVAIIKRLTQFKVDVNLPSSIRYQQQLLYFLVARICFYSDNKYTIEEFLELIQLFDSLGYRYSETRQQEKDCLDLVVDKLGRLFRIERFCKDLKLKKSPKNCPKAQKLFGINSSARSIKKGLDWLIQFLIGKGADAINGLIGALQLPPNFRKTYFLWLFRTYKPDINKKGNYGSTVLMTICSNHNIGFLKWILKRNKEFNLRFDENVVDDNQFNFFLCACESGSLPLLKYLIEDLKVVTNYNKQSTPSLHNGLHHALRNYQIKSSTIKYLSSLDSFNPNHVCTAGHTYLVEFIMSHTHREKPQNDSKIEFIYKMIYFLLNHFPFDEEMTFQVNLPNQMLNLNLYAYLETIGWPEMADYIKTVKKK